MGRRISKRDAQLVRDLVMLHWVIPLVLSAISCFLGGKVWGLSSNLGPYLSSTNAFQWFLLAIALAFVGLAIFLFGLGVHLVIRQKSAGH